MAKGQPVGDDQDPGREGESGDDGGSRPQGGSETVEALREKLTQTETLLRERESSLQKANREAAERRKRLESYEGVDPEEYRRLKKESEDAERRKLEEEGEYQKLIAAKDKELSDERAAHNSTKQSWDRTEIRRELLSAAGELDPIPQAVMSVDGAPSQIERLYADEFERTKEGKILHRTRKDEGGNPLTVKAFLLLERKGAGANLFRSTMGRGAGSEAGGGSGSADEPVRVRKDAPDKVLIVERLQKEGKRFVFVE